METKERVDKRILCNVLGCQWSRHGYCQSKQIRLDGDRNCRTFASLRRLMEEKPRRR